MKYFILLLLITSPSSLRAEITTTHTASTSLTVGGTSATATRLPSSVSVSGNNVQVVSGAQFSGLTAPSSATASATQIQADFEIVTAGSAFTFSESFQSGDPIPGSGIAISSGVVGTVPTYGELTVVSGGVKDSLAGTAISSGVVTAVAGGPNTTAVAQVSNSITVK